MDARGALVDRPPRPSGFLADRRGTTAIEYALLAAVVAIFAIGGLQTFATGTGGLYAILDQINLAITAVLSG